MERLLRLETEESSDDKESEVAIENVSKEEEKKVKKEDELEDRLF